MKIIKGKRNLKTFIVIFLPAFLILYPAYGLYCPRILCYTMSNCPTYHKVGSTCYYSLVTCSAAWYTGIDICILDEGIKPPFDCVYADKCIIPPDSCSNRCTVSIGACSESGCVTYYSYCAQGYVCSNGACVSGSCGTSPCPSDGCVGNCGTGLNSCVWRDYPASCNMYCDGSGNCASCTCTYSDFDADNSATYCSGCGKVWFSSVTAGQNAQCCGDDGTSGASNDIFENRGAGNSACVEAQVVSHNNISSSQRYLVYNGEIYYCRQAGETGSQYSFVTGVNPGSSIGSWKCGFDGKWRGGSVIGIRGGRIKIVA